MLLPERKCNTTWKTACYLNARAVPMLAFHLHLTVKYTRHVGQQEQAKALAVWLSWSVWQTAWYCPSWLAPRAYLRYSILLVFFCVYRSGMVLLEKISLSLLMFFGAAWSFEIYALIWEDELEGNVWEYVNRRESSDFWFRHNRNTLWVTLCFLSYVLKYHYCTYYSDEWFASNWSDHKHNIITIMTLLLRLPQ
jgi:hypothetical protein